MTMVFVEVELGLPAPQTCSVRPLNYSGAGFQSTWSSAAWQSSFGTLIVRYTKLILLPFSFWFSLSVMKFHLNLQSRRRRTCFLREVVTP